MSEEITEEVTELIDETTDEATEAPQYLTKADLEAWAGTNTGRLVASQLDKKVMPLLQELSDRLGQRPQPSSSNPDLQEMIFGGDVGGAIDRHLADKTANERAIIEAQNKAADKLIVGYAEDPLYNDIHPEMDKIAKEKIRKGWPPEAAVVHARAAAETSFLRRKLYPDEHEGLEMASGGRQKKRVKKVGLPDMYKAACQRDIADGIVKDEAEYIRNMSPAIRRQYGL